MHIQLVESPEHPAIRAIWNSSSDHSVYQSPAWMSCYAAFKGTKAYFFLLDNGISPTAYLACIGWRRGLLSSFWSGSKGGGGGPVFDGKLSLEERQSATRELIRYAFDFAQKNHYSSAAIFSYPTDVDLLHLSGVSSVPRRTPVISLEPSVEELFSLFSQKIRQYVRGAARADVEIVRSGRESLPKFREMQVDFARERGLKIPQIQNIEIMASIWDKLEASGSVRLYQARRGAEILGISLVLYSPGHMFHHSVVATEKGKDLHVSEALQWKVITDAKELGVKTYNLVGAPDPKNPRHGVTDFKLKFAATLTPFNEYFWQDASLVQRVVMKLSRHIPFVPKPPIIFYP